MDSSATTAFRPLDGVRVVELAQNLAGPWCARILADLGATVVKVEPPAGDAARAWGPPFDPGAGTPPTGTPFTVANPGKRFLRLDLRADEGAARLWALLESADVLVEAFRPGALERLGFGEGALRQRLPRLIHATVAAYGAEGPLSDLPGYEPLMQAHAGMMSVTGEAEGAPVRVGTSVVDLGTGMWLAIGVLAALRERDRAGRGRRVTSALYETALSWNGYHMLGAMATGEVPGRHGSGLPMICPYGAFPTTDGSLMVAVGNDRIFERFARALDRVEWLDDPRFATNPDRVEHRAALDPAVEAATRGWSTEALLARLREFEVPAAPILDVGEVLREPQTEASGLVERPASGPAGIRIPLRFDGVRPPLPEWDPEKG